MVFPRAHRSLLCNGAIVMTEPMEQSVHHVAGELFRIRDLVPLRIRARLARRDENLSNHPVMITCGGACRSPLHPSSPRRTIGVVGSGRAGALAPRHPPNLSTTGHPSTRPAVGGARSGLRRPTVVAEAQDIRGPVVSKKLFIQLPHPARVDERDRKRAAATDPQPPDRAARQPGDPGRINGKCALSIHDGHEHL